MLGGLTSTVTLTVAVRLEMPNALTVTLPLPPSGPVVYVSVNVPRPPLRTRMSPGTSQETTTPLGVQLNPMSSSSILLFSIAYWIVSVVLGPGPLDVVHGLMFSAVVEHV